MKYLFIIDPLNTLIYGHDSSLALMKEAYNRGHEVFIAEMHNLFWNQNHLIAHSKMVNLRGSVFETENGICDLNLSEEAQILVFMRKDPPVDENYTRACQLLRLAKIPVINNPNSLLFCDEKLLCLEFPSITPETFICKNILLIKQILQEKKQLIAKPIGGKAGEGIIFLQEDDKNTGSILEIITNNGQRNIILQEYLIAAREGDKRIFLLNGEPIGAVLRIPRRDDNRANMAAGGSIAKTTLSEKEKEICATIKSRLLELGLYIVGIDVIDGKLTEINITSPTCLEEISKFDGVNLAEKIIIWSENKAY